MGKKAQPQSIRQRILALLSTWPENEMSTSIIAEELGITWTQANASIQGLYGLGLVERTCPTWYAIPLQ